MFAPEFDSFHRKLKEKAPNVLITDIKTVTVNTPEHEEMFGLFMSEHNTNMHVTIENNHTLFTFYTLGVKENV